MLKASRHKLVRRVKTLTSVALKALILRPPYLAVSHVSWLLVGGLVFVLLHKNEFTPVFVSTIFLFFGLIVITTFDARLFIIPDICLLYLSGLGVMTIGSVGWPQVIDHCLAAVLGFLLVHGVNAFYRVICGGEGIGHGDAKFLAVAGYWVGADGLLTVCLWASLSGLLSIVLRRAQGTKLQSGNAIPFGPHLAVALWMVWLFGPLESVY